VLTDDDISPIKAAPVTQATTGENPPDKAGAGKASADKNEKKEEDDPKSEAYWRKRFGARRDKLAQAEQELNVLQRELDTNQVQYYSDPQKAMMQQHDRSDINEQTSKIDAKKREIESLKQQLSDMEDDLRKAGGDPGWAR
jgi:chromosome segregation ATPase